MALFFMQPVLHLTACLKMELDFFFFDLFTASQHGLKMFDMKEVAVYVKYRER